MPVIIKPNQMDVEQQPENWSITTLADSRAIGVPAMVARRWSLDSGALSTQRKHGQCEQLLYVISGSGKALVNGETLPLEPETVLWLDTGDIYQFIAGDNGLEILQAYAPGE